MDDKLIPFPQQTAEQINLPQTGKVELGADEIRSKLVEMFNQFKPTLQSYYDYAERATALGQEYHSARFKQVFPAVPVEPLTLVAMLDSRETPASLDSKLGHLEKAGIKRILLDQAKATYYLFA